MILIYWKRGILIKWKLNQVRGIGDSTETPQNLPSRILSWQYKKKLHCLPFAKGVAREATSSNTRNIWLWYHPLLVELIELRAFGRSYMRLSMIRHTVTGTLTWTTQSTELEKNTEVNHKTRPDIHFDWLISTTWLESSLWLVEMVVTILLAIFRAADAIIIKSDQPSRFNPIRSIFLLFLITKFKEWNASSQVSVALDICHKTLMNFEGGFVWAIYSSLT